MKRAMAALAFLALTAPMAWAQLRVKAEREYAPHDPIVLTAAEVTSAKAQFLWDVSGKAKFVEAGGTLYVWAPPGEYAVTLTAIDFDAKKVERAKFSFTVTGKVTPPGPKPDDPPDVKPAGALRVLVVYESADASRLPASQQSVLYGKTFRDALDARTPVGPDGKAREWRIYDADVDLSGEAKAWRDLMARPRTALPWVVLSYDSGVAFEGPLPKTVADAVALLDKHAPRSKKGGR